MLTIIKNRDWESKYPINFLSPFLWKYTLSRIISSLSTLLSRAFTFVKNNNALIIQLRHIKQSRLYISKHVDVVVVFILKLEGLHKVWTTWNGTLSENKEFHLLESECGGGSSLTWRQLRGVHVHLHPRFECELDEVLVQSTEQNLRKLWGVMEQRRLG